MIWRDGDVGRTTTVRRNRFSEPRGHRAEEPATPRASGWSDAWVAAENVHGVPRVEDAEPLAIAHLEAFPPYAGAVLRACREEASERGADLHTMFVVNARDDRPFVAYVGIDPPVLQGNWTAVLDTGGEQVTDVDRSTFLLSFGWEPDPDDFGQWYRSWPADAQPAAIAADVGLVAMRVLDPMLRWQWEIGITVFRDDPAQGRVPIGDATAGVLQRIEPGLGPPTWPAR